MTVAEQVRGRVRGDAPTAPTAAASARSGVATWMKWYGRTVFAVDFLAALAATITALVVRFSGVLTTYTAPYVALSIALPFAWVLSLALVRAYDPRIIGVGSDEFRRVLQAGFTLTATVAILAYATKTDVARGYVVMALPMATVLNLSGRYWLRKYLHKLRADKKCMRRVVAVGHRGAVVDLLRQLRSEHYHGMEIVAVCLPVIEQAKAGDLGDVGGVPVLGDFSEAALVVNWTSADTVAVLACPEMDGFALRRLAWQLEKDDTDLVVAPALMDVAGPRTSIRPVAGLPLLHVDHPELTGVRQLAKSMFDRVLATISVIVLAPVLIVIPIVIRMTSPGKALFKQIRVGKDGREFTVYKFRTMVPDAERRKAELLEHNETDGVLFKMKNDPRITGIGAWLRRYSLDELPQLFNVLRGDMSLVGPRPP